MGHRQATGYNTYPVVHTPDMEISQVTINNAGSNTFAFSSTYAHRIANLHSSHATKLADQFGIEYPKHWPQTLPKPTKPHLAELIYKAISENGNVAELEKVLPTYEQKTADHEKNRTAGRPIMKWANSNESESHYTKQDAEVENIVVETITAPKDAPVTSTDTAQAKPKPTRTAEGNRHPLYEAVKQVVIDVIGDGEINAGVDEDAVREIARDEDAKVADFIQRTISEAVARIHKPTIVTVTNTDTNTSTDMGIQHKEFPTLLKLAQVRGPDGYVYPVWLPGPAGSGKTTAAKNVSKALNIPFHHNGAIDTEYKLLGYSDANGNFHDTPFYRAYKDGGVYLFDEVDASSPQSLVALNAALENGSCVFGNGECVERHKDCIIIAAANTYGSGATHEYVGRNKLDAATVDRFVMLAWEYDEVLERTIAKHDDWVTKVQRIRKAVKDAGIKHVVSPRASFRGADMLRAGMPEDYVMQAVVYKGLSEDQVNTIKARAR